MASYNLNKILKEKAQAENKQEKDKMDLGDAARVKVLSPSRQVFKRFIRNKLAVFGTVLLIIMFVFSFCGPWFYHYGQKQVFYKYDAQNVDYALAKQRTEYVGYKIDDSVEIDRTVSSKMNTYASKMESEGLSSLVVNENGQPYLVEKTADNIYQLSEYALDQLGTFGHSETKVASYSMKGHQLQYADGVSADDAFEAAVNKNVKGKSGEFTSGGVTYTFRAGSGKTFDIYAVTDGFTYTTDAALGADFEAAVLAAAEAGEEKVTFDGVEYSLTLTEEGGSFGVAGESVPVSLYSRYALDLRETGASASDAFRVAALEAAANGTGKFTADGASYTIKAAEDALIIYDSANEEYAEFTTFVIRRYNGDDTMEYGLKKALIDQIEEMESAGKQSGTFSYVLPQQGSDGKYVYDEEGNLQYSDGELTVTRRNTGEYVVNCEQTIYLIDIYASPSRTHLLGTDGDGFDVLARIMYGGRISLMVGFVVVILETVLGVIMGGLAGYFGGWVDNLIMRLVDIFYCLPMMPIMIIIGAVMDAMRMGTYIRLMVMMAALGVMGWAGVARLVRGQILSLREQEFMVATEATGMPVNRRIFRHLIPNVMPQLIVTATMGLGSVILTESTLSFLGLGVKHPLATWGTMINSVSTATAMTHYTYIWIPVGFLICLTVIAFNFVGDGLRDAFDPKMKR